MANIRIIATLGGQEVEPTLVVVSRGYAAGRGVVAYGYSPLDVQQLPAGGGTGYWVTCKYAGIATIGGVTQTTAYGCGWYITPKAISDLQIYKFEMKRVYGVDLDRWVDEINNPDKYYAPTSIYLPEQKQEYLGYNQPSDEYTRDIAPSEVEITTMEQTQKAEPTPAPAPVPRIKGPLGIWTFPVLNAILNRVWGKL